MDICYKNYQEELVRLRRHFHQNPELSMQEEETSRFIFQYLEELGLDPVRVGCRGVTAMVWSRKHRDVPCRTVAVRAEMDALPLQEEGDCPWRSQRKGVMHACGHDAIMATALVLARICAAFSQELPVNVKFLFQPAEENGEGTEMMLQAGVMEDPHVDDFLMFHYVNDAPGGLELHRGEASAAIGSVLLKIRGKEAHWCSSGQGIDAIAAGGQILQEIADINKNYQSEYPFVLGIGMAGGGRAKNIVAGSMELQGTLRACTLEDYEKLRSLLLKRLAGVESRTGAVIRAEVDPEPIPPIINDDALVDLAIETGRRIWGGNSRLSSQRFLSGDSAAYYFHHARGIFMVFTAAKEGRENYPLHSSRFDLEEEIFWKALATLHQFLMDLGNAA